MAIRGKNYGMVIPPFLMGLSRRIHAAIFSFMAGVMPPMPMLGRSLLVFDGSASMDEISFETDPNTRIVEARQAIRRAMPGIAPFRRVGLLIYGPGPDSACQNLDLRFGPIADAAGPVIDAVEALRPDGLTPLTDAVRQAAEALDYRNRAGVVVLVTDGNETCGGRPCEMAPVLSATARDLTIHVIGFRAVVDFFAWNNPEQDPHTSTTVARCLADETGGLFVTTETVDELVAALQRTLGCPVIGCFYGSIILLKSNIHSFEQFAQSARTFRSIGPADAAARPVNSDLRCDRKRRGWQIGRGSGRWHRFSGKQTEEDFRSIDVRRWKQAGLLSPPQTFNWQWTVNGNVTGSINVQSEPGRVILT